MIMHVFVHKDASHDEGLEGRRQRQQQIVFGDDKQKRQKRNTGILSLGFAEVRMTNSLGDGGWVEEGEVVVEAPVVGPGFFAAAGYFEDEVEELPAYLLDCGVAGGDGSGVDVDEVGPALG